MDLHLISHTLCPYVQRAAIALAEKQVDFRRTAVDLSAKPEWFLRISPLGRTPVLVADGTAIFESAVILEFLDDTCSPALHPADPFERARHRSWIEFGSAILNDIGRLYNAGDEESFDTCKATLRVKFRRIEDELGDPPYFDGSDFSLVDAAYGPVFRYFDTFEELGVRGVLDRLPKTNQWRTCLALRPSVSSAVEKDYPERLLAFLERRNAHISTLTQRVDNWSA